MNNILEVRGLRKSYGTFTLNDVSFNVPSGYIMGFIGPNGAGKTTTIKLMLGIIKRDTGTVNIFGSDADLAQNENIGVVMDAPMYVDEWTLTDVESAISPFYKQWDKGLYADYIKRFGLDTKRKSKSCHEA